VKNHRALFTVPVLAFLACGPTVGISSDIELSPEEAKQAVTQLVQAVGPAFECEISNISLKNVSTSDGGPGYFIVSYDARGLRCDEAAKTLNYRTRSKGLRFERRPKPERIDKIPEKPNLDLIHEVNPSIEVGN